MKKLKYLIVAALVVCMAICMSLLAVGCNNEDKDHFVVTINYPDGSPVKGVAVWLCSENGVEQCLASVNTDNDGVATIDITSCEGSTKFSLHFTGVPDGYVIEGTDDKGYLYFDTAETGYKATITLKQQASANLPEPELSNLIKVNLANKDATQQVTPVVEEYGYYQLRSTTEFTIEGEGYSLKDGYITVIIYIEEGTSFKIGTASAYDLDFTIAITPSDIDTENTHSVSAGTGAVFKLGAGESVNLNNGISQSGSSFNIIVNGENMKATYRDNEFTDSFAVASGYDFSVTRADGAAGTLAISCTTPVNNVTVDVGSEQSFEITLIEGSSSDINWLTEEFQIMFYVAEQGKYLITVTSSFSSDKIEITQVGGNSHFSSKLTTESSSSAGNSYRYYTNEDLKAGTLYSAFLSVNNADYSGYSDGDTITYTVTVEKM